MHNKMHQAILLTAYIFVTSVVVASSVHAAPPLPPEVSYLIEHCAPGVAPSTMRDVVAVESRGEPFAVNVNGSYKLPRQPRNAGEAAATIRWLSHRDYNFDVGYTQVNSSNFESLGVSGLGLLNGCTNLRAGAAVLSQCYAKAAAQIGEGQAALRQALSCYNTGSSTKGFHNGYVAKVMRASQTLPVPALLPSTSGTATPPPATKSEKRLQPPAEGERGAFGHSDPGAFVTKDSNAHSEKAHRDESQDARVPDSAKAAQDGAPRKADQKSKRVLPRPQEVDPGV